MRLLLTLNSMQDTLYDNDYHYHLQSLFYRLMLESGREDVHERSLYKHFCFSNIFPFEREIKLNSRYNLLFSTPDTALCNDVFRALSIRLDSGGESSILRIGDLKFRIEQLSKPFRANLTSKSYSSIQVKSATPIIIRIPSWRYKDYSIKSDRPFEFWRESIALESFVKQLNDGVEKKLIEFVKDAGSVPRSGFAPDDQSNCSYAPKPVLPEILSYRYMKSVSKPITVKGQRQQAIGSIWEFEFLPQSKEEEMNLELAIESGFGERNSLGFGFMNIV